MFTTASNRKTAVVIVCLALFLCALALLSHPLAALILIVVATVLPDLLRGWVRNVQGAPGQLTPPELPSFSLRVRLGLAASLGIAGAIVTALLRPTVLGESRPEEIIFGGILAAVLAYAIVTFLVPDILRFRRWWRR